MWVEICLVWLVGMFFAEGVFKWVFAIFLFNVFVEGGLPFVFLSLITLGVPCQIIK